MSGRYCKGLAAVLLLGMMGCTVSGTKEKAKELALHLPQVSLTLDPHRMEDAYSMAAVGQIYRGLLRFDSKGDVHPDLAQSWTESPDRLRYAFRLKSAQFSDGTPITPRHVQLSFARMFHLGASMGADLNYLEGVNRFRKSNSLDDLGIRVISDQEIEFTLSQPSAIFLKQLAVVDCAVLPLKSFDDALSSAGPFSGPYRVTQQTPESLFLEKWRADILDSPAPPVRVTYRASSESPESLAMKGQTDSLDHDRVSEDVQRKLVQAGWKRSPTELAGQAYVILNPKVIAPETRAYLAARVDRKALLNVVGTDRYRAAHGVIPDGVAGSLSSRTRIATPSTETVSASGSLDLEFEESNPLQLMIARYLQSAWSSSTFRVNLKPLPKREKMRRQFGKLCQACIGYKGMDYPDGYAMLAYFRSGYEANFFHVEDPAVDQALGKLLIYFKDEERESQYRELEKRILNHFTFIPLFSGSEASGLWSPRVKYVPPHPIGLHALPLETVEMGE